jgi:hypothetical protein
VFAALWLYPPQVLRQTKDHWFSGSRAWQAATPATVVPAGWTRTTASSNEQKVPVRWSRSKVSVDFGHLGIQYARRMGLGPSPLTAETARSHQQQNRVCGDGVPGFGPERKGSGRLIRNR